MALLVSACDMNISFQIAADNFGRAPSCLAWKAHELRIGLPPLWRQLIRTVKPKANPRIDLQYPYIIRPDERHSDIIAVNRLVSSMIPGRDDVCQDILLALWESKASLAELRNDPSAVRAFVKAFRKTSFEQSGYAESMDVTVFEDGRSKYEDARYGADTDFTDTLIDDIDTRESAREVPAALWMRIPRRERKIRVRRPNAPRSVVFHADLKKWVNRSELE